MQGKHVTCKNRKALRLDQMEKEFFWNFLAKNPYSIINGDDKAELKRLLKKSVRRRPAKYSLRARLNRQPRCLGRWNWFNCRDQLRVLSSKCDFRTLGWIYLFCLDTGFLKFEISWFVSELENPPFEM